MADDFRCLGTMPVTSVHWWGSYEGWQDTGPPRWRPDAWHIAFWSNIPAGHDADFSHPQKLLWSVQVPVERVKEEWVGVDQFPDRFPDTCFQYHVDFKPDFSSGSLIFEGKGLVTLRMFYIFRFVCSVLYDKLKQKVGNKNKKE